MTTRCRNRGGARTTLLVVLRARGLVFFCLMLLLLCAACRSKEDAAAGPAAGDKAGQKPLLEFDGRTIPKRAFLEYLHQSKAEEAAYDELSPVRETTAGRLDAEVFDSDSTMEDTATQPVMLSRLLDRFVIEQVLLQQAGRHGISPSQQAVDSFLHSIMKDLDALSEDQREVLRRRARETVVLREFVSTKILADLRLDAQAVVDYYEANPRQFTADPRYRFRWLHFHDRAEADRVHRQVRRSGVTFEEISDQQEIPIQGGDPGDLGLWVPDEIPERFRNALARTSPGGTTEVLEDPYGGFLIFQLLEVLPGRALTLEEARPVIEYQLREEKARRLYEAYVSNLVREKQVKIHYGNLDFTYVP